MLHFAYGANLCRVLMRTRCPAAAALCPAVLPDHRLIFCRFASFEPHPGSTVPGALWALSPECETALDQFEGLLGGHYRRATVQILREGMTRLIPAMAYQRVATDREPPPAAYLDLIRQGYEDFGLDVRALEAASIR